LLIVLVFIELILKTIEVWNLVYFCHMVWCIFPFTNVW